MKILEQRIQQFIAETRAKYSSAHISEHLAVDDVMGELEQVLLAYDDSLKNAPPSTLGGNRSVSLFSPGRPAMPSGFGHVSYSNTILNYIDNNGDTPNCSVDDQKGVLFMSFRGREQRLITDSSLWVKPRSLIIYSKNPSIYMRYDDYPEGTKTVPAWPVSYLHELYEFLTFGTIPITKSE